MRILKSIAALAVALLALAMPSCSDGPRTVGYPIVNFSNTTTIDIVKVELTDTATVLDFSAHFRPGWWIRINSNSYLLADGKRYALTGAQDFTLDSEFAMPESGEANFKLFFEPLPFSTKEFDFIEGDIPDGFKLMGVDISGKPQSKYPKALPKELQKDAVDGEVPEPALEMGRTTINVHLLPYIESMANVTMYVNTLDGNQEEYSLKMDSLGVGTVSFDQYGPAQAYVVMDNSYSFGVLTLYPGETIDYYADMRMTGKRAMANRDKAQQGVEPFSTHNGRYANYDLIASQYNKPPYYGLDLYTGEFADYHMNGKEYKDMVKSKYLAFADSIAAMDAPEEGKEHKLLNLQGEVLSAISNYKYFLGHNYRSVKDDWRGAVPTDSITAELTDADFADVATWFDLGNTKLLLVSNPINFDWNAHAGVKGDLYKSLKLYAKAADDARNNKLDRADVDSLKAMSNPFFAQAVDSIQVRSLRKMAELSEAAKVMPTPEVADDKVFDAIIAPHKGKVVMVDLWNTWCGPCRAALKANEPLKDDELADDDIVFIYIADESSDPVKYLEMIPEIKGLHYKVNDDQISAIRKRFDVDGIPYYILVDRQGKAEGRPDLRDHKKYISEIKSKL